MVMLMRDDEEKPRFRRLLILRGGSAASAVSAPTNSVAPVISGNQIVGQTLSTTDGTWTGSPTFTYQWKRAGVTIASATANTYVLVEADAGAAITCVVTGTNGAGNSTGTSNTLTINVFLVFLAHIEDPADATIYSGTVWDGISLGAAAANRKIVITPTCRGPASTLGISSASVAGQATAAVVSGTSDSSHNLIDVQIANVPSGTSGNIIITWGDAKTRCGCGVYAVYGAGSSTPSDTDKTEGAADGNVTLTVPAQGVAIGASYNQSTSTCTWTGLTERYDAAIEGAQMHSGADLNSSAGGNINMISDWALGDTNGIHVFASWGL